MLGMSIGIAPQNTTKVIAQLKKGLPVTAFNRLRKHLGISEKALAGLLHIPISTLARRKKSGRLSFEESERVFRIARLYDKAMTVFDSEEMAGKWLKTPAWSLGDVPPLVYAETELGAQEVEGLLGSIEDGVFT